MYCTCIVNNRHGTHVHMHSVATGARAIITESACLCAARMFCQSIYVQLCNLHAHVHTYVVITGNKFGYQSTITILASIDQPVSLVLYCKLLIITHVCISYTIVHTMYVN